MQTPAPVEARALCNITGAKYYTCQNSKFWQYGCIMLWRRQDESCLKIPDCSPWLVESWPSSLYCFCADLAPDFPAAKLTACTFFGCQCHAASSLAHRAGCPGLNLSKRAAISELSGMRKSTRGNRGLNGKADSGPVVCGAREYEYIADVACSSYPRVLAMLLNTSFLNPTQTATAVPSVCINSQV